MDFDLCKQPMLSEDKSWEEMTKDLTPIDFQNVSENLLEGLKLSQLEKILRLSRLVVTSDDNLFHFGDIIFDKKNREFGIVLCKKPIDMPIPNKQDKITKVRVNNSYVLLTLTKNDIGCLQFRVRYTNEAFIQVYEGNNCPKRNQLSDLDIFCKEQCFMECSDACALYKYTRKTDGLSEEL